MSNNNEINTPSQEPGAKQVMPENNKSEVGKVLLGVSNTAPSIVAGSGVVSSSKVVVGKNETTTPKLHTFDEASWFSKITLSWVWTLIKYGYYHELVDADLPIVPQSTESTNMGNLLEKNWEENISRTLYRTFWTEYLIGFIPFVFVIAPQLLTPFFIQSLLTYLNSPTTFQPMWGVFTIYPIVGMMALLLTCQAFGMSEAFQKSTFIGTRARIGLAVLIYRKSLRLSSASRSSVNVGDVLNLMSGDIERVFLALLVGHALTYSFIMIASVTIILSVYLGVAGFVGILIGVVLTPITMRLGTMVGMKKRSMLFFTDRRVSFIGEVLNGISTIKMLAWEDQIQERISKMRQDEMVQGNLVLRYLAINSWLNFMMPMIISGFLFGILALTEPAKLTLPIIYSTIAFLSSLSLTFDLIPRATGAFSQANVSIKRINEFLMLEESELNHSFLSDEEVEKDGLIVRYENVELSWSRFKEVENNLNNYKKHPKKMLQKNKSTRFYASSRFLIDSSFRYVREKSSYFQFNSNNNKNVELFNRPKHQQVVLRNLNFTIKKGELVVLVGRVGSGKSSLLCSLLNEIEITKGQILVDRQVNSEGIAYASQEPWIQNATLKENVTFLTTTSLKKEQAKNVDEELYSQVIKATELESDLKTLPKSDMTEIGSKGINLSGGQKSRVALARTVYRAKSTRTNLVVLDDPFSSLDPIVASRVFSLAIQGLLKGKTIVLALNSNLHLCTRADKIILLGSNDQQHHQTIEDIGPPGEILSRHSWLMTTAANTPEQQDKENSQAEHHPTDKKTHLNPMVTAHETAPPPSTNTASDGDSQLYKAEELTIGSVSVQTYLAWFRASSQYPYLALGTILGLYTLTQGSKLFADVWLGSWARSGGGDLSLGLGVYYGVFAVMFLFSLVRSIGFVDVSSRASTTLHKDLINNLMKAPVATFFDVTPIGRITNRIAADVDHIDTRLPEVGLQLLHALFVIGGALILAAVASPYFLLLMIPLTLVFLTISRIFARTSRQIKRLESKSKSPLFSQFQETLSGLTLIRAFKSGAEFAKENSLLANNNLSCHLLFWLTSRWFALRVDIISVVCQVSISFLVLGATSTTSALGGLALVYSLQLTTTVQACTRYFIDTENAMVSVERLRDMIGKVPLERESGDKDFQLSAGSVEFVNVSTKYRAHLPMVLKNFSFKVEGGKKVGVCGRTGAGKSSVLQLIFGLLSPVEGKILIDGVDFASINLKTFRKQIAAIPQFPVILSGTVRFSLDPWNSKTDAEIWEALYRCEIGKLVEGLPLKLDSVVEEGGVNFSVGERQLMCVARALLKNAKLVIIDEGTASVDRESERLVQKSIDEGFPSATVFVIAHRVASIMKSDTVIVLDKGTLVEEGEPQALLREGKWFKALFDDENKEKKDENILL